MQALPVLKIPSNWQEVLSDLVVDPEELLAYLQLSAEDLGFSPQAMADFPLRVPRPYMSRMRIGDPRDPLLLQVLPSIDETIPHAGYGSDPLAEAKANKAPGLLHKYQGRALLMPTSSCAIHCRYCFRRHFPYHHNNPGKRQWQETFSYLRNAPAIEEVILSGGDPLSAANRHLRWLGDEITGIPHIRRLRIHTRLPLMIPQRIDEELCQWLAECGLQVIVVLHCNHGNEIDEAVERACRDLQAAGVTLLNQSVLLKGINDDVSVLARLSERLFAMGVLPYYLHVLDKVAGTAHFDLPEPEAVKLLKSLQSRLPGYLVPKLVKEVAGKPSKTIIDINAPGDCKSPD